MGAEKPPWEKELTGLVAGGVVQNACSAPEKILVRWHVISGVCRRAPAYSDAAFSAWCVYALHAARDESERGRGEMTAWGRRGGHGPIYRHGGVWFEI